MSNFYYGNNTYTRIKVPGVLREVGILRNDPDGNRHRFWWGWRGSLCTWHMENQLAFLGTGEVKRGGLAEAAILVPVRQLIYGGWFRQSRVWLRRVHRCVCGSGSGSGGSSCV